MNCYAEYYSDIYYDPEFPASGIACYLCKTCGVPLLPSSIIDLNVKERDTCYCSKCRSDLYQIALIALVLD
jgi:hypothetical protein